MSVPVKAEVRHGLPRIALSLLIVNGCKEMRSGTSAGPSNWGRLTRKC